MGLIHPPSVTGLGSSTPDEGTLLSLPVTARNDGQYSTPYDCPFPLHVICCTEQSLWKSVDYKPGRIIIVSTGPGTTPDGIRIDGLLRSNLHDCLCTQDVLFVPMYEGTMANEGPWPAAPTLGFDHNLEVLRDVAPQVRAVLVGNRYAESGHLQCITHNNEEQRAMSSMRICQFVEDAAQMVKSVNGRLGLCLIDFQIILDCYWAPGQPLRAKLLEHNVLTMPLLGFKFWPKMKPLYDHDREERILPKAMLDGPPYPAMTKWLEGLEAWSGVDYINGLMLQHPQRLFDGGFKAGVIGQLPDGTM